MTEVVDLGQCDMGADEMDRFSTAITPKLDAILAEQGEMRTATALIEQHLGAIQDHLRILNGRTAKSEDRLVQLEAAQRVEDAVLAQQKKLMLIAGRVLKYGGTALLTYFLAKYPELAKLLTEAAR